MKMKINSRLRIRLESFNHEILVSSYKKITDTINNLSTNSIGLIHLPTSKRIYCVLRSPHVYKDSREHFEIRTHKRLLEIWYNSEVPIFEVLSNMNLAPGVFYRIDLF